MREARGPGTVLVAVYALFALAAGARSIAQLVIDASAAPVAYGLSVVAAVVYLVGCAALWSVSRGAETTTARAWCVVELVGVIVVGAASMFVPDWFPRSSVWSGFGAGYGFVPTALPLLALWWLRTIDRRRARNGRADRTSVPG